MISCSVFDNKLEDQSNEVTKIIGVDLETSAIEACLMVSYKFEMTVTNSLYCKRNNKLFTKKSGPATTQIDYLLVKQSQLIPASTFKVFSSKECTSHHKVCSLKSVTSRIGWNIHSKSLEV